MRPICIIFAVLIHFGYCYKVEPISSKRWLQSYSLYYDEPSKSIYFVDYLSEEHAINRYDIEKDRVYSASVDGLQPISFILPVKKRCDRFLIGNKQSAKMIAWNGKDSNAKVIREVFNVENEENHAPNFWSIAKVSPKCQFYSGTLRTEFCSTSSAGNGSIYSYSRCCGVSQLVPLNQQLSAGFDWNVKKNKFYHIDTCKRDLREYDWDPKTGAIRNERIVFDFSKYTTSSFPVGLTLDTKGSVYVAMYYGGAVWKINPSTSTLEQEIKIPAKVVSSVTFGGENRDILFVSSGRRGYDFYTGQLTDQKFDGESGSIFMVKGLCAKGFPKKRLCI